MHVRAKENAVSPEKNVSPSFSYFSPFTQNLRIHFNNFLDGSMSHNLRTALSSTLLKRPLAVLKQLSKLIYLARLNSG